MSSNNIQRIYISGSIFFQEKEQKKITSSLEDADAMTFYGDDLDMEEFFNFVNTMSLFNDSKLAIVHKAEHIKDNEDFIKKCSTCIESTIILTAEKEPLKKLTKALEESKFKIIKEGKPRRQDIVKDINRLFNENGFKIGAMASSEIYEIFAGDLTRIKGELDKLNLYFLRKKPDTESEILKAITSEKQENIFKFIDSFSDRNKKECIRLFRSFLENNENFNIIYSVLFKRVKEIYLYQTHPSLVQENRAWMLRKIKDGSSRWNANDIRKVTEVFADTDYQVKTGRCRIDDAIMNLIGLM